MVRRPFLAAATALAAFAAFAAFADAAAAQAPASVMPTKAPPPASAAAPATAPRPRPTPTAEQLAAGKTLLSKVVGWLGGQAKVDSVKNVQTKGQLTAKTPEGDATMEVQSAMVFPDRLFQQIDSPYGRIAMVVTPAGAFLVGPNGSQDLPPIVRDELLKQVQRIPLHLVQRASDPKLSAAAAGAAKVGDVETALLDLTYGPMSVRWYVEPATGRIVRTEHVTTTPDGKTAAMISDYFDYKPIDGIPIAHRLEVTSNGEKDQTLVLEECLINAGVDPKLFDKPAPAPRPSAPAAPDAPAAAPPNTSR